MTDDIRVFVNAAPVTVPPGATVLDAVRAWKPGEARDVEAGSRLVTDSRGLPIEAHVVLQAGAILRTVPRRDGSGIEADPDPEPA